MSGMTVAEAAEILRKHNDWRRDRSEEANDKLPQQSPKDIGIAIDVAVAFMTAKPDGWIWGDYKGDCHVLDGEECPGAEFERPFKYLDDK